VPLSALDSYRPTDYDNAVAACKPIWDAAQAAGVLLSDSSRYVKSLAVGFGWVKLHSLEGVRVEIEPAAPLQ
jgi:hypothetical protein